MPRQENISTFSKQKALQKTLNISVFLKGFYMYNCQRQDYTNF